jgi:hypothetical protein
MLDGKSISSLLIAEVVWLPGQRHYITMRLN